ncbi:MAG: hypothetical protein DMF49_01500 [Acidobacteria bacterium]|nr:MAG: hypothetical protein DMF49_01500 [Acidobacteriota bacterium]
MTPLPCKQPLRVDSPCPQPLVAKIGPAASEHGAGLVRPRVLSRRFARTAPQMGRHKRSGRAARRTVPRQEPFEPTQQPGSPTLVERIALCVILGLAALLLLYGLGAPRLWQDEAETALLGRNTLRFGLPRVWDGNNLVAQFYAIDFDSHLLFGKSWLPSYLVAGFFALFGQGTFTARLPFALCGLMTVWLTWRLGRKLAGDGLRWGWLRFGAAIGLLFHVNYLVCGATAPSVVAGRVLTRGWRSFDRRLVAGLFAAAVLTIPFFICFPPFAFAAEAATDLSDYPSRTAWVLGDLNRCLLPLPGIAILSVLAGGRLVGAGWSRRLAVTILLSVLLSNLTLWPRLVMIIGFRYVINILPLAALLFAGAICSVRKTRPAWIAGLVGIHLFTHLLGFPLSLWPPSGRPGLLRTDLYDYAESLLRPVRGPIDGAVEFLQKNSKRGDFLFTPRRDWEGFIGAPSEQIFLEALASRGQAVERFVLDAPDLPWQAREYPPRHLFRTPADVPPVVIYRISAAPGLIEKK